MDNNQAVYLSEREWQQVMGLISLAPWRDANPLLMKIGEQLQRQAGAMAQPGLQQAPQGIRLDANGQEVRS